MSLSPAAKLNFLAICSGQTNATNVTWHPFMQARWGHIWKRTVAKSQINATDVAMHPLRQAIWGRIWKHSGEKSNKCNNCDFASSYVSGLRKHLECTVAKSQTNATNVTLHSLRQAIWGRIWKHTVEKSQRNAKNVTLHLLM